MKTLRTVTMLSALVGAASSAHGGGASTAVAGTDDSPPSGASSPRQSDTRVLRGSAGRAVVGARVGVGDSSDARNTRYRWLNISGYVKPTFGVTFRPEGVPQDRWDYSAAATQVGVEIQAEPIRNWLVDFHMNVTGETLQNLTGAGSSGNTGEEEEERLPFAVTNAGQLASAVQLVDLTLGYRPVDPFLIKVGQMRIPFTLDQRSASTDLLFAARNTPSDVFMRGSDLGALASYDFAGVVAASAGVFNGATVTATGDNERGALFLGRLDVTPLGPLPNGSNDFDRGPFRIGISTGVIYMPGKQFDRAGFELTESRDLRASAAIKLAVRGLTLQMEGLRRQRTTNIASRPLIATGAYGQLGYYMPVTRVLGVAPIARVGWLREDESFDALDSLRTEVGLSFYLQGGSREPDDMRITLQYLGEQRLDEGETAHGMVGQLQLRW